MFKIDNQWSKNPDRLLAVSYTHLYHNSLNELGKTTVDELCHYKGIGPAKAITILARCV